MKYMKQKIKGYIKIIMPKKILGKVREYKNTKCVRYIKKAKIRSFRPGNFEIGINLVGPINQNSGLGQSCRLLRNGIDASEIACINFTYPIDSKSINKTIKNKLIYGINIFHINAHEFERAFYELKRTSWDGHYNIAFWLWELEDFPDKWVPYIRLFDEIWTPAEFVSKSIRQKTNKQVFTIPYGISAPFDERLTRKDFGLPENQFLFLMAYDKNSVSERKNPMGSIMAFKAAFSIENVQVGLVIKISNSSDEEIAKLSKELAGYQVYYIKETLTKVEMNSLIKLANVYVSLHRAEGFGLILAEAMLLGTPTIATNYSANTEFMNPEVACMVKSKLVEIQKEIWPYSKGNHWAEPDIEVASAYMKKLYSDAEFYDKIKKQAHDYVAEYLNEGSMGRLIKKRYEEIYRSTKR